MPATDQRRGMKHSATGEIKRLTRAERRLIDSMVRHMKASATDSLREINKKRAKKNEPQVEKTCDHRYVQGLTHKPETQETRGRKPILTKEHIRSLDQARRRLIRAADNDHRVTYKDVIEEAGLKDECCQRVCSNALRALGVGFSTPRRKIYITDEDAKKRKSFAFQPYDFSLLFA